MSMYSEKVELSPQFQRAVRIDLDWGSAAPLKGFVCQASSATVLRTMSAHLAGGQQGAFTWTGPYGGGKSLLALQLATLLGGEATLRKLAREALGEDLVDSIARPFRVPAASRGAKSWNVVLVAGRHEDAIGQISDALAHSGIPRITKRLGERPDAQRILRVLGDLAAHDAACGLLLIVDELGKVLEHTAGQGGDIHFFQELAEVASRSKGRLIVVGILHQAFEQYAARLGREARDEWAKIQGRFADIPFIAGIDEVVELTGKAISTSIRHPQSKAVAAAIASVIRNNRPATAKDLADRLDKCWPLHPVTAALLGPVSKRRFGQNERSTFAFLGSSEPFGFREFLNAAMADNGETYRPARYWDYLRANLEPSILISPDGHRWAQATDAVARCEGKGGPAHVELIKTIAIIDLFRNGSGLVASEEVLRSCLQERSVSEVKSCLRDMIEWSVIVYRKHANAFGVFEGSDFDIETAVNRMLVEAPAFDVARLARLAPLRPILAKKHYQVSGALRWFEATISTLDALPSLIAHFRPDKGCAGRFILVIPGDESERELRNACREFSLKGGDFPLVVGLPPNGPSLRSLSRELLALESLRANHPELSGDPVARKELQARISAAAAKLENEFLRAVQHAEWYVNAEVRKLDGGAAMAALASELCDSAFKACPRVMSELVNRSTVSSNAQAAVNALVEAMVAQPNQFAFGLDGYGPERGLYETVYRATGLHAEWEGQWAFVCPAKGGPSQQFIPLWRAADRLLADPTKLTTLSELLTAWSRPPFGLNTGLLGLVALAYIFSNRAHIAVYLDGIYQPDLQTVLAHEVLRDPSVVALRRVVGTKEQSSVLSGVANVINDEIGIAVPAEPLALGRALVKFLFDLPPWVRRTSAVSPTTAKLRSILLSASDPHKLALVDLPSLAASSDYASVEDFLRTSLRELASAYEQMVDDVRDRFFKALGARDTSAERLHERAAVVQGLTGDLRVEALAVQLSQYDGSSKAFSSVLSLAISKRSEDWTDLDVSNAVLTLADLALHFRRAEVLAAVQGRNPSRLAIGMVVGTGEAGRATVRAIDVGQEDIEPMRDIASQVLALIERSGHDPKVALAALAHAGVNLMEKVPEEVDR